MRRYVLRRFAQVGAASVLIGWSGVGVAGGVDLSELFALAKLNDPTFAAASSTLEAVRQRAPQAFSALMPALSANGSGGDTVGDTAYTGTPDVRRKFNSYAWTLQLTQPVLRAPSLYAYDESKALVQQADAQFGLAQQDLIIRVAEAYFDVLVAQEALAAADAQLRALEEQLKAASRSFKAGVASVTDVDETRARAASSTAQQVAASGELAAKRAALEAIIGSEASDLARLRADAIVSNPDPDELSAWIARAEESNPKVRAAKAAVDAASYEVSRTRAQRLPAIDLVASYGATYSSGNIVNPVDYATHVHDKQMHAQIRRDRSPHPRPAVDKRTRNRRPAVCSERGITRSMSANISPVSNNLNPRPVGSRLTPDLL